MRTLFLLAALLPVLMLGACNPVDPAIAEIDSFTECADAGYPIMESYPEQCRTPDGRTFVNEAQTEIDVDDMIHVDDIEEGDEIELPLTITGEARGIWYFEASFPVSLLAADDTVIATGIAQAQDDWMTEEFVPFEVELTGTVPASGNGKLIFRKDNPSGLPQNEASLTIPVTF